MFPEKQEPWLLTLLLWERENDCTGHLYPIHRDAVDEAKWYCDFLTRCFFRPCPVDQRRVQEGTWNS